jgi:hypothetical protein
MERCCTHASTSSAQISQTGDFTVPKGCRLGGCRKQYPGHWNILPETLFNEANDHHARNIQENDEKTCGIKLLDR